MSEFDVTKLSDDELYCVAGILMCERMIVTRGPEIDAKIDEQISALNHEIANRERTAQTSAQCTDKP